MTKIEEIQKKNRVPESWGWSIQEGKEGEKKRMNCRKIVQERSKFCILIKETGKLLLIAKRLNGLVARVKSTKTEN